MKTTDNKPKQMNLFENIDFDNPSFSKNTAQGTDIIKTNETKHRYVHNPYPHLLDKWNSWLVDGATFSKFDIPCMRQVSLLSPPKKLIPFSVAMNHRCTEYCAYVHFYEDDYLIDRFWNHPNKYLDKLYKFAGVIAPDFSTCRDMPIPIKDFATYKNMALGSYLQKKMRCIPNLRGDKSCLNKNALCSTQTLHDSNWSQRLH